MTIDLKQVADEAGYSIEAFVFVQRGLDFTVRRIHGEMPEELEDEHAADRHVSGQDLCRGLRDFAIDQYGLMARSVLRHWNIIQSEDFGKIVFAMVEAGLMHKTDNDRVEDFRDVFVFSDAFGADLDLAESELNNE